MTTLAPSRTKTCTLGYLLSSLLLLPTLFFVPSISKSFASKKQTHLHFYIHMIFGGLYATSITTASPDSNGTFFSFGTIRVFDHELREGPDPASRLISRLQGTATQASLVGTANLVEAHHVFTQGEHRGSTLTVFKRHVPSTIVGGGRRTVQPEFGNATVANIIGGTGKFMLAKGYSIVRVYGTINSSEATTIVLEDYSYFKHYEIKKQGEGHFHASENLKMLHMDLQPPGHSSVGIAL